MGKGALVVAGFIVLTMCAHALSQGDIPVVNINTASEEELDALPGIGPARARAIVGYRELYGPFQDKEEITEVYGIGKGIYSGIKEMITVGEDVAPPKETGKDAKRSVREEAKGSREKAEKGVKQQRVSTTTVTTTKKKTRPNDSRQVYYGGKQFIPRGCWSCNEVFFVPDDLKDGWCAYCGKKWSVR